MKIVKLIPFILLLILLVSCIETEEGQEIVFEIKAGVDTVEINTSWVDAGVTLTIDGVASTSYNQVGTVDINTLGTYTIEYAYITSNQMVQKIYRYVDVVDQTKPVMTLNPGIDTISLGETWVDSGVEVTDNSGEILNYTVTGIVNNNQVGFYTMTYHAEDSSGNETEIIRIVSIIE